MKLRASFLLGVSLCFTPVLFQSQKTTKEKRQERRLERDSVFMSKPYPYILPIMGDKAHERGYKIPLPIGIMFNTLAINQTLYIDRISIGFGRRDSGEEPIMYDLNKIVQFDKISANTSTYNIRVDTYLFPFLSVYGIIGQNKKADINIDLTKPFPLQVKTEVAGWYIGYGAMAQGKVGPIFLSVDANQNYNHNPRIDKPVVYSLAGLRAGPIFEFKKNTNQRLVVWVGAMYSKFNSETIGTINTIDLAPNAPQKVSEMQQNLDNWYNDLSNVNKIKYKLIYEALESGLTSLGNNINNSYISYNMNKTTKRPWNMLTGVQWQIDDHWQVRTEMQYLGDRTAGLFSINYRFGIKGRTLFSKKPFNDSFYIK